MSCTWSHPRGWYCTRETRHTGPCALVPTGWLKFWYRLTGRGDWL